MRNLRLKFHKWRWGVFERKANSIITGPEFQRRQTQWKAAMNAADWHFTEHNKLMNKLYRKARDASQ